MEARDRCRGPEAVSSSKPAYAPEVRWLGYMDYGVVDSVFSMMRPDAGGGG